MTPPCFLPRSGLDSGCGDVNDLRFVAALAVVSRVEAMEKRHDAPCPTFRDCKVRIALLSAAHENDHCSSLPVMATKRGDPSRRTRSSKGIFVEGRLTDARSATSVKYLVPA
jgi:hypothetical protein